jgi:iron complex transport system substrate-binding protein
MIMTKLSESYLKRFSGRGLFFVLAAFIFLSCSDHGSSRAAGKKGTNLIRYASRLSIEKEGNITKVTILNPWQGADNISMTWYLIKRGDMIPAGIDSEKVVFIPVRKIICMSTTHLAMVSAINEDKSVIGMSGIQYIYSPVLRQMAESGLIKDVGYESNLNKELIVNLAPDLVMIYGVGNESTGYVGKLLELGVKVMYNADYLETEPLAKAEWIKLFGTIFCHETVADSIFSAESQDYNELKSMIAGKNISRPKVMLGLPFKDTWFVSPGNSFISTLISDAGGDYLWKDSRSSVSMPLGLENVWTKAMNADYWLNISTVMTRDEIPVVDNRLSLIPCFIKDNLFNNNRRISPGGGNDFWESGAIHPHLILRDIGAILHPELFPDKNLYYYRKIE